MPLCWAAGWCQKTQRTLHLHGRHGWSVHTCICSTWKQQYNSLGCHANWNNYGIMILIKQQGGCRLDGCSIKAGRIWALSCWCLCSTHIMRRTKPIKSVLSGNLTVVYMCSICNSRLLHSRRRYIVCIFRWRRALTLCSHLLTPKCL